MKLKSEKIIMINYIFYAGSKTCVKNLACGTF